MTRSMYLQWSTRISDLAAFLCQAHAVLFPLMMCSWRGSLHLFTFQITTPPGLTLKPSQGSYQYSTILLQLWNGLMENRGKWLRLHHGSKLSESHKSGKQMLISGKHSCQPLLSESLGEKRTNTMHFFLNTVDLLRINVLKMLSWKNSEYNWFLFKHIHEHE